MKDYLKEELSEEEKLMLYSIIWNNSKLYKERIYKNKNINYEWIENSDKVIEDTYTFYTLKSQEDFASCYKISKRQKCNIAMDTDSILREFGFFELIETLTFDEKLVFFLFYIEKLDAVKIMKLLKISKSSFYNKKTSIKQKTKKMKGELENG